MRLRRTFLVGDLLALLLGLALTVGLLYLVGRDGADPSALLAVVGSAPAWFLLAHSLGLYHLFERHIDYSVTEEVGPIFMTTTVWVWGAVLIATIFSSQPVPLLWFFILWVATVSTVVLTRAAIRHLTRDRHWYRQDVLLIGDTSGVERVLWRIRRHPECGLDPIGMLCWGQGRSSIAVFDGDRARSSARLRDAIVVAGSKVDTPGEIADLVHQAGIARVVVAGWRANLDERSELMRVLATSGVFVDLVSGEPEALCAGASVNHLEGLPIMTVQPTRMTRAAKVLKRAIDAVGAAVGLILVSPLLAYAAIRIKLDSPGPVLFRQPRAGRDGETFEVVKFRTMVDGADAERDALRQADETGADAGSGLFKLHDDPRVTNYGAKLRRTSIDELPQLWNVLKGEMSLVGPRPLPLDEAPLARDHFADRLRVRPGMTGPWQIHGRSDIRFDEMVKLDYTYVSTWSVKEDFRLLIRTGLVVLSRRGAY